MKGMIVSIILLLASVVAHAETITLSQDICTGTNICYSVPNSAGAEIDYIDYSSHYKRLTASIDGELYDSGIWSVNSLTNVPLYSPTGDVIYITVVFSTLQKPCVRSGKATICPVVITLTSGSIQRNG